MRTSPWAGLAVLAFPTVLSAIDMNVLMLALPALTRDLGATATEQLWITDVYGFLHTAYADGLHVAGIVGAVVFAGLAAALSRVDLESADSEPVDPGPVDLSRPDRP